MHHTKDKGDLAVAQIIADLAKYNITSCIPISEHLPFDIIAISPKMTLSKIQCKYSAVNNTGTFVVHLRSCYSTSKKVVSKKTDLTLIDAFAVYCPDTQEVYYFSSNFLDIKSASLTVRVLPSKNNQIKNVLMATDFLNHNVIWPIQLS